jgi:methyl-accepting chemotaxis protein
MTSLTSSRHAPCPSLPAYSSSFLGWIGIDQINVASTQMDQVTQQNSALVEQNAAAAKALEQQSVSFLAL